jgi:hypothetical protein
MTKKECLLISPSMADQDILSLLKKHNIIQEVCKITEGKDTDRVYYIVDLCNKDLVLNKIEELIKVLYNTKEKT